MLYNSLFTKVQNRGIYAERRGAGGIREWLLMGKGFLLEVIKIS